MEIRRVSPGEPVLARRAIDLMNTVFAEEATRVGDAYLDRLLSTEAFWMLAALDDGSVIGALTAHVLPLTRSERSELMIYDVAVAPEHRREGVGARLVAEARRMAQAAGIPELFLAVDDEDRHALEFYRAIGGAPSDVTIFTFRADGGSSTPQT